MPENKVQRPSSDGQTGFERIAIDLLNLEINTIVKGDLTARKMPPAPMAVAEILTEYYWFLVEINHVFENTEVEERLRNLGPETRENGSEAARDLRAAVRQLRNLIEDSGRAPPAGQSGAGTETRRAWDKSFILDRINLTLCELIPILERLERQSSGVWGVTRDALYANAEAAKRLVVPSDDVTFIRKAWEIGVEEVAIQSVIQLDGDVVTRVSPRHAGADSGALHTMHLSSCRMGIEMWQALANLVRELIGGALSTLARFFGGRG